MSRAWCRRATRPETSGSLRESYTLTAVSSGGDFGFGGGGGGGDFGGGGGGGGSGSAARQHASGDGEEEADYGTLALELPEEPMAELTIGGETLPLSLELAAAEALRFPTTFRRRLPRS